MSSGMSIGESEGKEEDTVPLLFPFPILQSCQGIRQRIGTHLNVRSKKKNIDIIMKNTRLTCA